MATPSPIFSSPKPTASPRSAQENPRYTIFQPTRTGGSEIDRDNMPSPQNFDEQIYEVMQRGRGITFQLQTGGVKYKAVLQHREARASVAGSTSKPSADSSTASSVKSPQS
ncbi:uncharacterized protein BP5553_08010 [Venustampulla echinocandica]|uniref:Uncharacterized protein n=1 Tax=Venustampulla echinocandica TaxID=2656787 RepID=A0A370TFG7_9HELO|nr:uncharacterized protein BP5553_08010 [Venustampulla echinocandica]RDL33642.1 hypothetical protein BP5553_08010 [Venustampulla echinocandica]